MSKKSANFNLVYFISLSQFKTRGWKEILKCRLNHCSLDGKNGILSHMIILTTTQTNKHIQDEVSTIGKMLINHLVFQ
jgi:hypothetical protein